MMRRMLPLTKVVRCVPFLFFSRCSLYDARHGEMNLVAVTTPMRSNTFVNPTHIHTQPSSFTQKTRAATTEVQILKAEVQTLKTNLKEIEVEVKDMKANKNAIWAFLRDPIDCPSNVDTLYFEDCRTMSRNELVVRLRTLEQDIRDAAKRIDIKEQDIRDKEKYIRKLSEVEAMRLFTYEDALSQNATAVTTFPATLSQTRYGRYGFDKHLADIFASLMAMRRMTTQDSVAIVLQCASGVGKTFACNTFRRGQLNLKPSVDYTPLTAYLGLAQDFKLIKDEEDAVRNDYSYAIQSVLYQRFAFVLNGILQEVRGHRDGPDRFTVLDGADDEWVQRLPFSDSIYNPYNYRTIEDPKDVTCIFRLVSELKEMSTKKLAILVCLDEGQKLDELAVGNDIGGARLALRALRELQVAIFNATKGWVMLLPITTGIDAKLSLASCTDGSNVVFGAADEALMKFDDFKSLMRAKLAEQRLVCIPKLQNLLAAAHYPHVREMLKDPTTARFKVEVDPSDAHAALKIAKAAFTHNVVHLNDFPKDRPFPVGKIPVKLISETAGIPVLSFLYWNQIHHFLLRETLIQMPTETVSSEWLNSAKHWVTFEMRCFKILRYFFAIFGPVPKIELFANSDDDSHGLRGPLRLWIPDIPFVLSHVQKTGTCVNDGVLDNPQGYLNPFQCANSHGHAMMADYPLTYEYRGMLEKALSDARPLGLAQAVWVMCGGSAPIDYILVVFSVSAKNPSRVTVNMRFADAKHINTGSDPPTPKEMCKKAKSLHSALSSTINLLTSDRTLVIQSFDDKHMMLCHNVSNTATFSPATFEWRPWSDFLFCDS